MKDIVITLDGKIKCYVVDELDYKGKKYIFCFQLDDNDEMIKDSTYVLEVTIKNDKLITKKIQDFEVASVVNNMFLSKLHNN